MIVGNVGKQAKQREIRNLWSSEILSDENRKFCREKVKFLKFCRVKKISKTEGKSETGGKMHHGLRGDGRPWVKALTQTAPDAEMGWSRHTSKQHSAAF